MSANSDRLNPGKRLLSDSPEMLESLNSSKRSKSSSSRSNDRPELPVPFNLPSFNTLPRSQGRESNSSRVGIPGASNSNLVAEEAEALAEAAEARASTAHYRA